MDEIQKAERALRKAKESVANKKRATQIELNKFCIGKCFKRVDRSNSTITIHYENVLDFLRYNDGKNMYGDDANYLVSEQASVSYTVPGYIIHSGDLQHIGPNNSIRLPIKKHYDKGVVIAPSAKSHYSYFSPLSKTKDVVYTSYNNQWVECSIDEFNEVREKSLFFGAAFKKEFSKYSTLVPYTDHLIDITVTDRKLLEDLLKKVEDKSINLKDYITVAKKSSEFMKFDNFQLQELAQYNVTGDKNGMQLTIVGGDGGSDYEPYVTRYILEYVNIDWLRVLYTIRLSLDSVQATAKELSELHCVNNTNNWNVSYSGSYDVSFDYCTLNSTSLAEVNRIIKSHLK